MPLESFPLNAIYNKILIYFLMSFVYAFELRARVHINVEIMLYKMPFLRVFHNYFEVNSSL